MQDRQTGKAPYAAVIFVEVAIDCIDNPIRLSRIIRNQMALMREPRHRRGDHHRSRSLRAGRNMQNRRRALALEYVDFGAQKSTLQFGQSEVWEKRQLNYKGV